ncbi:MAG TPA: methylated-DNA--[protein]-cysteine S-methyltransferase [Acidimicrobiales bacterium]|nr:methylated-DNA--[protein]-cysteine S-methyltransferase [Acidimicrobiales bacterium]
MSRSGPVPGPSRDGAGPDDGLAARGYLLFPTDLGTCGVAWGPEGIEAVQLPEADGDRTEARLRLRAPGAAPAPPPPAVVEAVRAMTTLLAGEPVDLTGVAVDLASASDFDRRVYLAVRAIPPGQTRTYGQVAEAVGEPGAAQAVGRAMGTNPVPIVVPCHRVMGAGGRPVGFSAHGGVDTKLRMLRIEGAAAGGPPTLFD